MKRVNSRYASTPIVRMGFVRQILDSLNNFSPAACPTPVLSATMMAATLCSDVTLVAVETWVDMSPGFRKYDKRSGGALMDDSREVDKDQRQDDYYAGLRDLEYVRQELLKHRLITLVS